MSQSLTINGVSYVPADTAARTVGYTKIYILMLVKEGKIDGKKIGQKWFVNLTSAEAYFKHAEVRKKEQREVMRREGQARVRAHAQVRTEDYRNVAVLHTLVVMIIGFGVGVTGYLGTISMNASLVSTNSGNVFEQVAKSLYLFISGDEVNTVTIGTTSVAMTDLVVGVAQSEAGTTQNKQANYDAPNATSGSGIVVIPFEDTQTAASIDAIRNSFADPVSVTVDPEHPDTGLIVPHFKTRDGEAYRFLMVPTVESSPGG